MNDLDNNEATLVLRGVLSLGRRLRAERPDGAISPAAVALLGGLYRVDSVPAVQLAAELRLQPQSLTRLLDALEDSDLITRTPSPHDRRERMIALTRRGRGAFLADMRDRQQWLKTAMSGMLTTRERATLLEAAQVMLKLADSAPVSSAAEPGTVMARRRRAAVV